MCPQSRSTSDHWHWIYIYIYICFRASKLRRNCSIDLCKGDCNTLNRIEGTGESMRTPRRLSILQRNEPFLSNPIRHPANPCEPPADFMVFEVLRLPKTEPFRSKCESIRWVSENQESESVEGGRNKIGKTARSLRKLGSCTCTITDWKLNFESEFSSRQGS